MLVSGLPLLFAMMLFDSQATTQDQTQSKREDSSSKKKAKKSEDDADKIADRILAETKQHQFVPKWYNDVYPALKKKYKNPVSRELYDTWRQHYFEDVVSPAAIESGYGVEPVRQQFMKLTEKQPSN
jgi:hypothetical protein